MIAHSLILLLAIAAVFTLWWLYYKRNVLSARLLWLIPISVLHVFVGVICVKAFAIIEAGSFEKAGNMSLFGAVFFLPVFYFLGAKLTKRKTADVFDVFTVPMVFTLACARINCLFSGCCLGRVIPGTSSRYPTRELELVFYAILLIWLFYRSRKGKTSGILYPVYMVSYGLFRFITEFFRQNESGTLLHLSHLWAALCFVIGTAFLMELLQAKKANNAKSKVRRKTK